MAEIIYTPFPKTFLPWFATFEIEVKSSGICKQKLVKASLNDHGWFQYFTN
jgi:hypothetical protein